MHLIRGLHKNSKYYCGQTNGHNDIHVQYNSGKVDQMIPAGIYTSKTEVHTMFMIIPPIFLENSKFFPISRFFLLHLLTHKIPF